MQPQIPYFFDPILLFLQDKLPGPAYSLLLQVLAHTVALLSGLGTLVSTAIEHSPWDINAQDILPPLITIFIAYLALLSLYRTTSWVIRTGFFLFKWGSILAFLAGGVGYFVGNGGVADIARNGVMATVGNLLWDAINSQDQYTAGEARSRKASSRPSGKKSTKAGSSRKPPHKQHHQWQQQEQNPAQTVIGSIVDAASKVAKEAGWLDMAKGLFNPGAEAPSAQKEQTGRKGKDGKSTRSR